MPPSSPEPLAAGSSSENCTHIKKLGYIVGKHVDLYGEHMVLVSDPFDDGDCVAVQATSAIDPTVRKIELPITILVGWEDLFLEPADPTASEPAAASGRPTYPAGENGSEKSGQGGGTMTKLTYEERKELPTGDFVFPKTRRYPIEDAAHARDALARSSGKPEHATVVAAVKRRYPEIDAEG